MICFTRFSVTQKGESLYEETTRVPLIVSQKGITRSGVVDSEHLVSSGLDFVPTVCDYAGIEPPSNCTGLSLRPLVEGTAVTWRDRLYAEAGPEGRNRMCMTQRYKYCVYGSEAGEKEPFPEMLFDRETDSGETKNLAYDPEYREIVEQHRKLLSEW